LMQKHWTTPDRSPTAIFWVLFSPGGNTCTHRAVSKLSVRCAAYVIHVGGACCYGRHVAPDCRRQLTGPTTSVPGAAALVCSRSMRCSSSSMTAGRLQPAKGLPSQSAAAVAYAIAAADACKLPHDTQLLLVTPDGSLCVILCCRCL
jgi:hypothetical protein